MVNQAWFVVIAAMLTVYAVLDGFDLGVGALHLLLARTEQERETAINTIGPVWNGNEVWLIAAGGALVVAFPPVYAAAFSGFYLALMLVLWLLILRGLGIEFRHQVDNPLWRQAWDVVFSVASTLLAVLFGVAFANVLRGVPLDALGDFQGSFALLLNPFSILGGVLALSVLTLHGAAYLVMRTEGALRARASRAVGVAWWTSAALIAVVAAASFVVRPDFTDNFGRAPLLLLVPAAGLGCLVALRVCWRRGLETPAFLASAGTIVGILGSAAVGLFPRLLPSPAGSGLPSLDVYNSAGPAHSIRVALGIYLFGIAIVVIYLTRIYRVWKGKVTSEDSYGV
ncbi:MAG: cytochrome d ubiquinol oxidase subunit II [Bacteroidales bacterium]